VNERSKLLRAILSTTALIATTAPPLHAQGATPPPKSLPAAPEHDLVVHVCSGCHVPEVITARRHTALEWDDIIARMVDHGAQASEAQQDQILAYLVRFYGNPGTN
jgi:hypothetical protein